MDCGSEDAAGPGPRGGFIPPPILDSQDDSHGEGELVGVQQPAVQAQADEEAAALQAGAEWLAQEEIRLLAVGGSPGQQAVLEDLLHQLSGILNDIEEAATASDRARALSSHSGLIKECRRLWEDKVCRGPAHACVS